MAQGLSLSSVVHVFPCPNCKQTINTSMQTCTFCSTPIDHNAAESSADVFAQVNQACSDASYLKILVGAAPTLYLAALFIPFIGFAAILGFRFLELAIPFLTVRWWIKFGSLKTDDSDFVRARRIVWWTSIGSGVFLVLAVILSIVFRRLVP